jgi:hypothetical protein
VLPAAARRRTAAGQRAADARRANLPPVRKVTSVVLAAASAVILAACGADPFPGAARIGTGPRFELHSLSQHTRAARPVGALACTARRDPRTWVHVELFARGKVLLLPPGIGIAPPRVQDGAYVRGGRCRYPLWTDEPTGLVAVGRSGLRLADLFRVWGRDLTRDGAAGFDGPVTVHVDGRRFDGHPGEVALRPHAQVVVQVGGPLVPPHADYTFPEAR